MGRSRHSRWANIHEELLQEILSRTFLIDQIHCRAVCKNWNKINWKDISAAHELPWLMFSEWSRNICKVYVPSHGKMYTILKGDDEERRGLFKVREHVDSAEGWLIFRGRDKTQSGGNDYYGISLYCPFTDEVINLPSLGLDENYYSSTRVCFSSNPTSSDCVFIALLVLYNYYTGKCKMNVGTCRAGDRTWKIEEVRYELEKDVSMKDVVYLDGTIYCLFNDGNFGSFHVTRQEWWLLQRPNFYWWYKSNRLMVSNNELLWVYQVWGDGEFEVLRFDLSRKEWVREETGLGDRCMFLNKKLTISSFAIEAVDESRELANTMHEYDYDTERFCVYKFVGEKRLIKQNSEVYSTDKVSTIKEALQSGLEPMWIAPPRLCFQFD